MNSCCLEETFEVTIGVRTARPREGRRARGGATEHGRGGGLHPRNVARPTPGAPATRAAGAPGGGGALRPRAADSGLDPGVGAAPALAVGRAQGRAVVGHARLRGDGGRLREPRPVHAHPRVRAPPRVRVARGEHGAGRGGQPRARRPLGGVVLAVSPRAPPAAGGLRARRRPADALGARGVRRAPPGQGRVARGLSPADDRARGEGVARERAARGGPVHDRQRRLRLRARRRVAVALRRGPARVPPRELLPRHRAAPARRALGAGALRLHGTQETNSYYGPCNRLAFNVGYHNEHNDFPAVPWSRLPAVRALAPEHYEALAPVRSYAALLARFVFDRRLSLRARVVR